MHDEATARRLWCPMARVAAHFNEGMRNNVAFNRDPDGDPRLSTNCIASECALWVWDEDEHGVCKQSGTGEPMRGRCGLIRR